MNIVLTARGPGLGAWLDPDFGRCGHLMLLDADDNFESWPNPYRESEVGAAALAQQLVERQVDAVVTGVLPPAAYAILSEANIPVYLAEVDAILTLADAVRQGELQPADASTVQARYDAYQQRA
ncbi:MAG: NifB/NifX family molybdenum-iron cluster-binding protein [Anaerolineae bacterium]